MLCGSPECDKVIVFTFIIFPDFVYYRVKHTLYPSNCAKLLRIVTATVYIMGVGPNFLDLGKTYPSARVRLELVALSTVVFEPHAPYMYNSYTILSTL